MPNLASLLKDEIARVVRKQLRSETESLKKASSRYRSEIAAMKRHIVTLEKQVFRLEKSAAKSAASVDVTEGRSTYRFSPAGLRAHRTRLGLSAEQMGLLVGVSANSIYNWESGEPRPRDEHLACIAAVRKMGKREVQARLDELQAEAG